MHQVICNETTTPARTMSNEAMKPHEILFHLRTADDQASVSVEEIDALLDIAEVGPEPIRAAVVLATTNANELRPEQTERISNLIGPFDRRQQLRLLGTLGRDDRLNADAFLVLGASRELLGGERVASGLVQRGELDLVALAQHIAHADERTAEAVRRLYRRSGRPKRALARAQERFPWLADQLSRWRPSRRRTVADVLSETRAELGRGGPAVIIGAGVLILAVGSAVGTHYLLSSADEDREIAAAVPLRDALAATLSSFKEREGFEGLTSATWLVLPFKQAEEVERALSEHVDSGRVRGPRYMEHRLEVPVTNGSDWLRHDDLHDVNVDGHDIIVVARDRYGQIRATALDSGATILLAYDTPSGSPTAFGAPVGLDSVAQLIELHFQKGGRNDLSVDRLLRIAESAASTESERIRYLAIAAKVERLRGELAEERSLIRELRVLTSHMSLEEFPEEQRAFFEQVRNIPRFDPAPDLMTLWVSANRGED